MLVLDKFYARFISPTQGDPDIRSRELILNVILIGIIALVLASALNSFMSVVVKDETYVVSRLLFILVLLFAFAYMYWLVRNRGYRKLTSNFITLLLFALSLLVMTKWGLQNPVASILFCMTIVVSGILLGARYSLFVLFAISVALLSLLYFDTKRVLHPNLEWTQKHISIGDVITFVTLFFVIALLSWLYNRQMEDSLNRARKSEKALKRQRDKLEDIVDVRTKELQAIQLQRIQHFYKFAELGHISTALFHDLSNFSTSLGIDVEHLSSSQESELFTRIQDNIKYINDVVKRVNSHLKTENKKEFITVQKEAKDIVSIASYAARKNEVNLLVDMARTPIKYKADLTKFRQVIMNLLSNAIEAYPEKANDTSPRDVILTIKTEKRDLIIEVMDFGPGISARKQKKIFDAFYSDKPEGTGIGLFIVNKVVSDLKGSISLTSNKKQTTFMVRLPLDTLNIKR